MGEGQGDHAAGARGGTRRVGAGMRARLAPPCQPVHETLRGSAGSRAFGFAKGLGPGYPYRTEAELLCPLFERPGQGHLTLA